MRIQSSLPCLASLRRLAPFCVLFALTPAPARAGSTVVGSGTPGSCTEAALNAAIGVANGTFGMVTFDCGAAPYTLVVSSEKALANGVIIDGGGTITLSGGNATRLFNIFQGSAVELRNLTLLRGYAAGGGCVYSLSSAEDPSFLNLDHVSFVECGSSLYGAGLAATQTHVTITDGSFNSNQATGGGGGAISLNGGSLHATRTAFASNSALAQGGALQIWFATATIAQSSFTNNTAATPAVAQGGGAIFLRTSTATVTQTAFNNNQSGGFESGTLGGALHLAESSTVALTDVEAVGNQAAGGGALWVDGTSSAQILRTTFFGNLAADGGAIESAGDVDVAASTFSDNRTAYSGGAIRADGGTIDLVSVTLANNWVLLAAPGRAALTWATAAAVNVHNSLFTPGDFETPICGATTPATFTFSAWSDTSCGSSTANGNHPNSVVALLPRRLSCGGLTTTHALAPPVAEGSGSCRVGDPATDQRGVVRPQGTACEIGAVELFPACDNLVFSDAFELGNTSAWN
jgi:predicted outer membrane repeat protein